MTLTGVSWTGSHLREPVSLKSDVAFDDKVFLAAGRHARGALAPGFTFNPVIGCSPISRACKHCYARTLVEGQWGYNNPASPTPRRRLKLWGTPEGSARLRTSAAYWRKPRRWNQLARDLDTPLKVFCGSLCDVGEDHPAVAQARRDVFELADATPWLLWLFLTKRPEVLAAEWPAQWRAATPRNVWVGATAEDQPCADARVHHLVGINAAVTFVSVEPMVGPVRLSRLVSPRGTLDALRGELRTHGGDVVRLPRRVGWTIAGGESGPGHETMDVSHLYALAAESACARADVARAETSRPDAELGEAFAAFYPKQDSGHRPGLQGRIRDNVWRDKTYPVPCV